MNSNKYTLDRFEGDFAIFLKRPGETEVLKVHRETIDIIVNEGDIVKITNSDGKYEIEVLKEETLSRKNNIQQLLNQLKNKQ